MKKKILVIKNDLAIAKMIEDGFGGDLEVFTAFNLERGESLFHRHRDAHLIIMGGRVGGKVANSNPLIKKIMRVYDFQGYLMANSGDENNHPDMMEAGCTHQVENLQVMSAVKMVLDLPYPRPA